MPNITPALTKHPLDWKAEKKTGHPIFCLAMANAWHRRMAAPGFLPDGGSDEAYDGVVVDPLGNETMPMTEAQYDAMISDGQALLRNVRDTAAKAPIPVQPKNVRILVHPDDHHAVIVQDPGMGAIGMLRAIKEAPDAQAAQAYEFAQRMLWPADGSPERADLMGCFAFAFHFVYPNAYLELAGWKGAELKKLG